MAVICAGPEFTLDEQRRLRLLLAGTPAEQAWPFPCLPGEHNPLRIDPERGVWAPPYPRLGTAFASGETGSTRRSVPATYTEVERPMIEVVNPSPCHPARTLVWISIDADLYLPSGTDSRAAVRLEGNSLMSIENPAPAAGTEMSLHVELLRMYQGAATIPAGGPGALEYSVEIGNGQGGAEYGQVRWQIRALMLAGLT